MGGRDSARAALSPGGGPFFSEHARHGRGRAETEVSGKLTPAKPQDDGPHRHRRDRQPASTAGASVASYLQDRRKRLQYSDLTIRGGQDGVYTFENIKDPHLFFQVGIFFFLL